MATSDGWRNRSGSHPHTAGSLLGALFITAARNEAAPAPPSSIPPHWYGAPQIGGAPVGRNALGTSSFQSTNPSTPAGATPGLTMVR